MSMDHYHVANLDQNVEQQLHDLERELGVVVVALERDPAPAQLSPEQLVRLKAAEQAMGKVLVAYQYS
jgi:hypothetical protein